MSFVENNLLKDENVKFSAKIHNAIYYTSIPYFIIILMLLFNAISSSTEKYFYRNPIVMLLLTCMLIPISIVINCIIIKLNTEFVVTNKRVIAKEGFFHCNTLEIKFSMIESIQINQSIYGKIFNFGNLLIVGSGGTKHQFKGIKNPTFLRKKVNEEIENISIRKYL